MPIEGNVVDDNDDPVQGATVVAVDMEADPPEVMGEDTTDSNGDYSITATADTTVHVFVEWDDGEELWNALSKPFVDVTADVFLVEDWEGSSPLDNWSGNKSDWAVHTGGDVIEGDASIEVVDTDDPWRAMYKDSLGSDFAEWGFQYRMLVYWPSSVNSDIGMTLAKQDTTFTDDPPDDAYWGRINVDDEELDWGLDGNNTAIFDNVDIGPLEFDTQYRWEIDWHDNGDWQHRILDMDDGGSQVSETATVNEDTYESGYIGMNGASGTGVIADLYEKVPLA